MRGRTSVSCAKRIFIIDTQWPFSSSKLRESNLFLLSVSFPNQLNGRQRCWCRCCWLDGWALKRSNDLVAQLFQLSLKRLRKLACRQIVDGKQMDELLHLDHGRRDLLLDFVDLIPKEDFNVVSLGFEHRK